MSNVYRIVSYFSLKWALHSIFFNVVTDTTGIRLLLFLWIGAILGDSFINNSMHRSTSLSGSEKLQILVDEWASCQGNWKESRLLERMRARKSTSVHGARVWMTRAQVAQKYGNQEVADEICNGKLTDEETKATQTKPHPDAPNSEAWRTVVWGMWGQAYQAYQV